MKKVLLYSVNSPTFLFSGIEGVWIFKYPIVQESVIQISMELPPQGQSQAVPLPELKEDLGMFFLSKNCLKGLESR